MPYPLERQRNCRASWTVRKLHQEHKRQILSSWTVDRQPSDGRILLILLSNEKRSKFNDCSSIDRHHPYFFLLIHKYYQLREVKNNLGDVTKAHFIALSMFDIYSETKSDRILLPE